MASPLNGARPEPPTPSLPAVAKVEIVAAVEQPGNIFAADSAQGRDALGLESALWPLAELAARRDSETPLTIGILGRPGSGKSFALGKLLAAIDSLSEAAVGKRGPFLDRVFSLRIDASDMSGEFEVGLASALYDEIGAAYPDFVHEAAHAVRDPRAVAHEATQRLDEARRRLDAERQNLHEIENRRARLGEIVLFESAGSQVDAYARANRAKIEGRLQGFGVTGDPIANYKSMVRDVAEGNDSAGQVATALRAFWAFKGQTRLLIGAVLFVLAGFGLGAVFHDRTTWLGTLRDASTSFEPAANWIEAHIDWLALAAKLCFAGAAVVLCANLLRGVRFLNPLFRGVSLLKLDVANRRQALDSLYAHQMRRVDGLEADVELAGRQASEAERRAGALTQTANRTDPSPFGDGSIRAQAERFFSALSASIEGIRQANAGAPSGLASAPRRLVIALDNIDCLPPLEARAFLDTAHRAFTKTGIVTVIATDISRLSIDDDVALETWIQVPFRVGEATSVTDYAGFIEHVIGHVPSSETSLRTTPPPHLDWSVPAEESNLLAAVAPLAGSSPRAVKRFVNLYRVARSRAPQLKGALALMLALDLGGADDEIAAMRRGLEKGDTVSLNLEGSSRLTDALAAAEKADGTVSVGAARRAAAIARTFSLRA